MNTANQDWIRRVKMLTQVLLISGALNIGLIATFVYFVLQDKKSSLAFESKPAEVALPITNQALLRSFSTMPLQELFLKLEDNEPMEEGFSKRDLALTCLVAFHNFNIEKAIGGNIFQKRKIAFANADGQESIDLLVFPGLTNEHYNAIHNFAKVERWPFTSRGLFYEIQRLKTSADPALIETFCFSEQFEAVSLLFSRSSAVVDKNTLLSMLLEGDWNMLERFCEEQKRVQDLTAGRRLSFLIEYLHHRSAIAAKLLLETDFEFVCKRLDDPHALLLLDLLAERNKNSETFAKVLLISPRSDAVWQKAASKLYTYLGEPIPETFDRDSALRRFVPELLSQRKIVPPPLTKAPPLPAAPKPVSNKKVHIIKEGDSLWKIAKKYHVTIEAIKKLNGLETEKLRPGKELLIPQDQGRQGAKDDIYKAVSK